MPVLTVHLPAGLHDREQVRSLLEESSRTYAQALNQPIDRVRVFAQTYDPALVHIGGKFVDADHPDTGDTNAPYFEFVIFTGQPDQRTQLLSAFTDLLVEKLGARRGLVRGRAIEVDPQQWAIGGTPAATIRAAEISQRSVAEDGR